MCRLVTGHKATALQEVKAEFSWVVYLRALQRKLQSALSISRFVHLYALERGTQ